MVEENLDCKKLETIANSCINKTEYLFFKALYNYLEQNISIIYIKEMLDKVKKQFINNGKCKKSSNTIKKILEKYIYSGYILIDANTKSRGLKYDDNKQSYIDIDMNEFKKSPNVSPIITIDVFKKVYFVIHSDYLNNLQVSIDFLFNGILKCSCGSYLHQITPGFLHCKKKSCNAFLKDNLLEKVLSVLLDSFISKSNSSITSFKEKISNAIDKLEFSINKATTSEFDLIDKYLMSNDINHISIINDLKQEISIDKNKISEYTNKLYYINKMQTILKNYYEKSYDENCIAKMDFIKSKLIDYILTNKDLFNPLFKKVIKEIKVEFDNELKKSQLELSIRYECSTQNNSSIS